LKPIRASARARGHDPDHPFVPNGVGLQPTFRIADLANPT